MKLSNNIVSRATALFAIIAVISTAVGLFWRFDGVTLWPLAVDEYYIFRSVRFILESGLPSFPCGGYYSRGILYQYAVAGVYLLGASPEFALRIITILSSLLAIMAVALIARDLAPRSQARLVIAALVIALSLSVWEIEMARFGRMYAPFQALFCWYVYHAWRFVTRGEAWRWNCLIGMSLCAPLLWEGGLFLAALNFVPMFFNRVSRVNVWRGVSAVITLGLSYLYISTPWRYVAQVNPFPVGDMHSLDPVSGSATPGYSSAWNQLTVTSWSTVCAMLVLGYAIYCVIRSMPPPSQRNPVHIIGAVAVCAAIVLHQIVLAMVMLAGLVLIGWTSTHSRDIAYMRGLTLAIVLAALAWIQLLLSGFDGGFFTIDALRVLAPLYEFPNYKQGIVEPWLAAAPGWFIGMALSIIGGFFTIVLCRVDNPELRWLLLILLLGTTFVAEAPVPYFETRYGFFMYPLVVLAVLLGMSKLLEAVMRGDFSVSFLAAPFFLAVFFIFEDFNPRHTVHIGEYEQNFRMGQSVRNANHFYLRHDFRDVGDYISAHAVNGDRIFITEVALEPYLPWLTGVYLDRSDERFGDQSCSFGTIERWTNKPLYYSLASFQTRLLTSGRGVNWIVVTKTARENWHKWEEALVSWIATPPVYLSKDGAFEVYRLIQ